MISRLQHTIDPQELLEKDAPEMIDPLRADAAEVAVLVPART